jgi:gliding motility-associated lipoprotein GldD
MAVQTIIKILVLLALLPELSGCREVIVPRPRGYFRISLPEKEYTDGSDSLFMKYDMPFAFEYPVYSVPGPDTDNINGRGWYNVDFPGFRAKIYLTYKTIDNDLPELIEQTYTMNVKNHITRADAIDEKLIRNDAGRIYGILYDLKGNTATAIQFYVTDSTDNYLRGSLYFDAVPNADSLAPVIGFLREDVEHLLETLRWRNN